MDMDMDTSTSYDDIDIRALRIELKQLKIMLHKINSYSSKSSGISSSAI